ncbi:MAG: PA2169 family four-helix-bundle protein [Burkholderiaceae bacterium]|nr:PA2169 family four-helix-bundle protein [Burkholderiaceae bacterium]
MSDRNDANRDPITKEPGAHPVGTGLGAAAGGAAAGVATGAFAGPVGAAIGGVVGAVAGGLAGKAAAEAVNPTAEEAYWREAYRDEPYVTEGRSYEDYHPAYALGWQSVGLYEGPFETVEPTLRDRWITDRGTSSLEWPQARHATRAARERALGSAAQAMENDDVVDVLNNLLETSRDGEYGFRTSAEHADSTEVKNLLSRRATDCATAARELEQMIRQYGGEPADGGTAVGAMHRGWVAVKTALSTMDDKAVLQECERGEDSAVAAYRKTLKKPLPGDVRDLVSRQSAGAQRNHDEVKAMRDRFANA